MSSLAGAAKAREVLELLLVHSITLNLRGKVLKRHPGTGMRDRCIIRHLPTSWLSL